MCFLLFAIPCVFCTKPRPHPQLIWCVSLPLWGQGPAAGEKIGTGRIIALAPGLLAAAANAVKGVIGLCPALERMSLDLFCSNKGRPVVVAFEPLAHVNLMLNDFLPVGMRVLLHLSMLEDDRRSEGFSCAPDETSRRQRWQVRRSAHNSLVQLQSCVLDFCPKALCVFSRLLSQIHSSESGLKNAHGVGSHSLVFLCDFAESSRPKGVHSCIQSNPQSQVIGNGIHDLGS